MQKKNVLGTDPLRWLKEKDKKENAEEAESKISSQKEVSDKLLEPKGPDGVSVQRKVPGGTVDKSGIEKMVKKSNYEPIGVSGASVQQEEQTCESSDNLIEGHRRKVLGEEVYSYHSRAREATQKESPATMFVIVYTVLLLILGFIVYRDLTKQIDVLDTKLTKIEKQVDLGKINYEDTKVNDVW